MVSFQEVLDQGAQTDDYYETQYAILRGRGLARRTIDSLKLWNHPLFNQQPGFSVRGLLMTPFNAMTRWFEPPRPIEAPGAEETAAQSRVIDRFLANLNVEAVRYSRLVDVSYRSSDPALAAKIANALGEAYIKQNVELTSTTTKEASDVPHPAACGAAREARSERAGAAGVPRTNRLGFARRAAERRRPAPGRPERGGDAEPTRPASRRRRPTTR